MTSIITDEKRSLLVYTNSKDTNKQKGSYFEQLSSILLTSQRYIVDTNIALTGMEIDIIAKHKELGYTAYVECKFKPSSAIQGKVISQIIGQAHIHNAEYALLFAASELTQDAKGLAAELATKDMKPKFVLYNHNTLCDIAMSALRAEPQIDSEVDLSNLAFMHLIIGRGFEPFWLLVFNSGGIPDYGIITGTKSHSLKQDFDYKTIVSSFASVSGLSVSYGKLIKKSEVEHVQKFDVVTRLIGAESLNDYRPSNPKHFVGRKDDIGKVKDFLRRVVSRETNSRILALTGPSGYGKSSLLLKLEQIYGKSNSDTSLFIADARSARGPLFIAKMLHDAMSDLVHTTGDQLSLDDIVINSTNSYLSSQSIIDMLDALNRNNKLLVLIIDQFEELLTKKELHTVFLSLRDLAVEVMGAQGNLVIGFSWRTGITLSDDHPAYQMWQEMRDYRYELILDEFTSKEASELVGLYEKALEIKFNNNLKRKLLEQGQGVPWLEKKLCIHVYNEIKNGKRQDELITEKINIKSLFDGDMSLLNAEETKILKYIAGKSPIDMTELSDVASEEMISKLYANRYIIRTGSKYVVYWDIFKDYLLTGEVPEIPWSYVPIHSPSVIYQLLRKIKVKTFDNQYISGIENKKIGSINNMLIDMQSMLIIAKNKSGNYTIRKELYEAEVEEVASYMRSIFESHIVIKKMREVNKEKEMITYDRFVNIIDSSYPNIKSDKTITNYSKKLLPWFQFTGLVEREYENILLAKGYGRDYAKQRMITQRSEDTQFLCASTPERAIKLLELIRDRKIIYKKEALKIGYRNTLYDLEGLKIIITRNGELIIDNYSLLDIKRLKEHVKRQKIIVIYSTVADRKELNLFQKAAKVGKALGKSWSANSSKRYLYSVNRWYEWSNI